jgi:hypothetical protein
VNIRSSLTSTQAKCLLNGKTHAIAFVRINALRLESFLHAPKKYLKEIRLKNESLRIIREEGRASIATYLNAMIMHTDFATGICGRPNGRGGITPYSIQYLADKAGITLDTAKKWHSVLTKCGYIANTPQVAFDKTKGTWSSLPSIKKLSLLFYLSLGIKKDLVDNTTTYFKKLAGPSLALVNSALAYANDKIKLVRNKYRKGFIKPESRKETERIPMRILSDFIPDIVKKF